MASSGDSDPDFFQILRTLIGSLPAPAPPYCLIGALALSAWGQPRATKDIDLLILLDEESQGEFLKELASRGFLKDEARSEHNPMLRGTLVRLYSGDVPIDLLAPRDAQEEEALTRRRMIEVEGLSLWTISPEDLVLMKLKAGRPYDFGDVTTVLVRQGDALDLEYLFRWAKRLGVIDELAYVIDQSSGSG
ncbi:MAG: hypothetical protein EWM72_02460 [Nitrospira sp.]|nr:MAG: hypothetical protein EWM72_02460 [Nitrospira sp.]